MLIPIETRPNITNTDIIRGYVTRYFTQSISTKKIYEINKEQHKLFRSDPYYTTIQFGWVLTDRMNKSDSRQGAIDKNVVIIEFYNKKMQGISRKLRNPAEYVIDS